MQAWVTNGGLVDTIIAITLLEIAFLLLYHQQTKRGLKPRDYLLNVVSGLCLMLALRSTLTDGAWYVMSALLVTAGFAHVADISLRLRQRAQNSSIRQLS